MPRTKKKMPRTKKKSPTPSSATLGAAAAALRAHEPDIPDLIQRLTVASVHGDAGRHCAAVYGLLDHAKLHLTDSLATAADSLRAAAKHAKPHLQGIGVSAFAEKALHPGGNAAKLTPRLSREEYKPLYDAGKLDRSARSFTAWASRTQLRTARTWRTASRRTGPGM